MEPGVALVNQVDSVLPADGWRPVRRGENTAESGSDQDLARGVFNESICRFTTALFRSILHFLNPTDLLIGFSPCGITRKRQC